jgi:hypothetical protein
MANIKASFRADLPKVKKLMEIEKLMEKRLANYYGTE